MRGNQGHTQQLWQLITQYNLDARHPELARAKRLIELDLLHNDFARDLLLQVDPLVQNAIDHPNVLKRPPEEDEIYPDGPPDLSIGHLVDRPDVRFGLKIHDRPRSVLISGNSGSGKTTAILAIIRGVDEYNRRNPDNPVTIIVMDKKDDYIHLPDQYGPQWKLLSVYDDQTRISLATPAGVPPDAWINAIATIFCARAGLHAAWTCLANMIRFLLAVMNPSPTNTLIWPSLQLILDVALAAPLKLWASKPQYEQSLIGQLDAITQATRVFDCFDGLGLERDIIRPGNHLVLAMPMMAPAWVRQFLMDVLLAQLLYGQIANNRKMARTSILVVLDESDQDATDESDRRFPDGLSILSQSLRLGREYGLMYVVGLGRLGHASRFVLSEPVYHLLFNHSDASSVQAARHTLVLPAGAEQMFPALQPGYCIARAAQSSWSHPMMVKIDEMTMNRDLRPTQYDTHPIIPAKRLRAMPDVQQALNDFKGQRLRETPKSQNSAPSDLAEKLLDEMTRSPWTPVARLWDSIGYKPSFERQNKIRKELELHRVAEFEEIRMGRANQLLPLATDTGYARRNRRAPKKTGRGGIAHQHICHWIAMVGDLHDIQSHLEWIVTGTTHPVDVAQQRDGKWHVYEVVVTAHDNLASHIRACFVDSNVIETLTIVTLQKKISNKVRKAITSDPATAPFLDRITFDVAETYMKELWPS
ncbi:MAG: ATP-binding protein [Planctomycetes bacterium]|nr:ATP-binding protein [Planctomycetota bacterium]NOG53099.1 ATP-binding protein [Planctomycetota bacterium]